MMTSIPRPSVMVLALVVWAGLTASATGHPGDEPLPTPEHDETTPAEDFLGVWEGAWDENWGVRFTVTPQDESGKEGGDDKLTAVEVVYEWEEHKGQPWQRREYVGRMEEGVLKFSGIELYRDPDDADRCTAIGRFSHERSAALTLVPDP